MMTPTRTPEGEPHRCPLCGKPVVVEPSRPFGDAPCPHCGCLLWFVSAAGAEPRIYGFHEVTFADQSIRTKERALVAIVERLIEVGALDRAHKDGIVAALLRREELGSTAIGGGVAIPHATHPAIADTLGAVAHFPAGIEFDSLDQAKVKLVYLVVSPADRPGDHRRVVEAIASRLRD